MKAIEIIIGIIFLAVAFEFFKAGHDLYTKSAIHEIYQMMYYICSVLCTGFGMLMIKRS